jgi:hypothetical protein
VVVYGFGHHLRRIRVVLSLLYEGFDLGPLHGIGHFAETSIVPHNVGVSPCPIGLIMHGLGCLLREGDLAHVIIEPRLKSLPGFVMKLRVILHFILILFQFCL